MVGGDENTWNLRDSHMADCLKSLIDFHVSSEVFFLAYVYVCMQMRVCGRGVLVVCARLLSCDLTSVDFR